MNKAVIIAAAGVGRRMNADMPKQYLILGIKPIICHTLDRFASYGIKNLVVAVDSGASQSFKNDILSKYGYPSGWIAVDGGKMRQDSVANAMHQLSDGIDVVLIHDGVRPFITSAQIDELSKRAFDEGACILASPMTDTVKRADSDGNILETIDRSDLWKAQTPQAFRMDVILKAMENAKRDGFYATDDANLVERYIGRVGIVNGDDRNIKITTPADLVLAESILADWSDEDV